MDCTICDCHRYLLENNRWHRNPEGYFYNATGALHRIIAGAIDGELVDHINLDQLDNRCSNLRIATPSQNQANRKMQSTNTSGYKAVYFFKNRNKWASCIRVAGHSQHLGCFDDPIDAALAYDAAAIQVFGEFARTNFL